MGVLGALLRFVMTGLGRQVIAAEPGADVIPGRSQRVVRHPQGVGTHVRDQTGQALALDLHAFVELLGHHHGALRCHRQLAGGFLLQSRRDEGRRRRPLFLGFFHSFDPIGLPLDGLQHLVGLLLAVQFHLALAIAVKAGQKALAARGQRDFNGPIFLGLEGLDLPLPVHDEPCHHRLHPARRKAGPHLAPQKRRQLIAHDAVQDAPPLLGVHQVHVDVPGVLHTGQHRFFGDLVECDPLRLFIRQVEHFL